MSFVLSLNRNHLSKEIGYRMPLTKIRFIEIQVIWWCVKVEIQLT